MIPPLIALLALSCTLASATPRPDANFTSSGKLFVEGSYFNSSANYDSGGGSYVSLGNGRYYRLLNSTLGAEIWLNSDISLTTRIEAARAQSFDGTAERTNPGLTEAAVGARYVMFRDLIEFVPDIELIYPFNRVDTTTDDVLTGEGVMAITAGAWLIKEFGAFKPFLYGAYRYRDETRASHALWRVGSDYQFSQFVISAEIKGYSVVQDDTNVDNPAVRDAVSNRVDGGSFKFYSVNPSEVAFQIGLKFNLSNAWEINSAFEKTINGKSSAAGHTIALGLQFAFDFGSRDHDDPMPRVLQPAETVKEFEPDTPAYDPTLFREIRPKPKKIKRKRKPIDIDKSLEEVQKSLEN